MTTALRLRSIYAVTFLLLFSRRTISIYFNGTTYIQATKPLNLTKPFSLSFTTCTGGQLLHQNGDNGLLFKLVVHPGKVDNKTYKFTESSLALSWQTIAGSRNLTVVNVGTQLDQNKPYDVVFTPKTAGQNANLTVCLGGVMYLVEVPDSFGSVEWENLTLGQGFVGCVTFGNMFNLDKGNGTSEACPLDSMTTCSRKDCPPGFKGYYCEINIDECASYPCHHASTCNDGVANYTCSCGAGWEGRNCDRLKSKTLCDDKPCLNGGICHLVSNFNNYTCTCPVPYTGRNCNETADPCGSMPCKNNATCENIKFVDFRCQCPTGFAGKQCETNIDDCATLDCGHGKCVDGINSGECNCTGSGYNGTKCKQDVNECLTSDTCRNNGTCTNYAGGFLCKCLEDYRGKHCEERIDDCASNPCQNGGDCTDLVRDFSCQCGAGYSGRMCEMKLHDCNVNDTCTACDGTPCIHGSCNCTCNATIMYYNCTCDDGYTGVNCDQDINECMNGSICGDNGTCMNTDGNFRCQCSDGFAGRFCNETEGPCNPSPCENGLCRRINITVGNSIQVKESYNCSCHAGWRGQNCSEDINECDENIDTCNKTTSTCINTNGSYQCECKPGYGGDECKDIDECRDKNLCKNRGSCQNSDGSFQCLCPNGFTKQFCEENINDCIYQNGTQRCIHGRCTDGVVEFKCTCEVGWSGELCNQDINECSLGYCVNGTCENTPGSYNCTCHPGFTDRNCSTDIDDCAPSPRCKNNGTCTDKVNDYECVCSRGYEGKSCEADIDWCEPARNSGSVPCDYGMCIDGLLDYTCSCFDGFSGKNCSVDKNECTDMPCNNSGICVQKSNATAVKKYFGADRVYAKNESGGYLCVCKAGYNGTNCQNNIDECALYRACNETGTELCIDGINNYTCNCRSGFQGQNCSEDINECASFPCQNNGTCQNLIAQYNCICNSNYTGVNCESLVDPCTALKPCRNGATCRVISDSNYTCTCAEGYAGRLCTDRTTLGFDGTSFMSVAVPPSSSKISFSFQTNVPEGVLVSQSSAWTLSLVSGKLQLTCTDSCQIEQPGTFNDFNWHRVGVFFDGSSVTANVSESRCMAQCEASRTRRSVTAESSLVVGADAAEDSKEAKFVGSIRDFSVNDVTYYPGIDGVNSSGIVQGYQRQNVCSPDPCVNGACKDLWTSYFCECNRHWTGINCTESVLWGTFGTINELNNGHKATSNKSYASYALSTTFQSLVFTVRTKSAPSLIIQLRSSDSRFISIETDNNGYLRLRDKSGDMNSLLPGVEKINGGVPRRVRVTPDGIQVDNTTYNQTLKSLKIETVFVGGLDDDITAADSQFRGCIRDVRVNGLQLLFFNQSVVGPSSTEVNVAKNCSGENVCRNVTGSAPCSGRGECGDLWNERNCTCEYPYGGDNCELYGCEWTNPCPGNGTCVNLRNSSEYECINEVTFNDSQSSARFTNSTPLSTLNSLTAQFRTRQNNTVILSSVHNATYFEIKVQGGRIMVKYNFSENMAGIVDTDLFISHGNWHELSIVSNASQTDFELSTMEQQQDKLTHLNNHSVTIKNVSLLSRPFTTLLSLGGVHMGSSPINSTRDYLFGCLREVRLGKHLLPFGTENGTADSSSEFKLARSAFVSAVLTNVRLGCHSNTLCTSSVCENGTCVEGWNTFNCTCPAGYHGDRCEFNPCTPSPCATGTCTVRNSGFKCTCASEYAGVFCNETCASDFCKNGGECGISDGKLTCTCEADWTGQLCESAIPRDDDDDDDNLPLIIGLAVAGGVLLLLIIVVVCVCTRQTSSTFGTYSPSSEEKVGARVEMSPVLNVPPPEKLI